MRPDPTTQLKRKSETQRIAVFTLGFYSVKLHFKKHDLTLNVSEPINKRVNYIFACVYSYFYFLKNTFLCD